MLIDSRRSPDRRRDSKRSRDVSASPDAPVRAWKPRKKQSNFDMKPPDGVELPGVGMGGTGGGSHSQASFTGGVVPTYGPAVVVQVAISLVLLQSPSLIGLTISVTGR